MTIANLILGCSLMVGASGTDVELFKVSEPRQIRVIPGNYTSIAGIQMHVTRDGKVYILTGYGDDLEDAIHSQLDVWDKDQWVQYSKTTKGNDHVNGIMANDHYYLYNIKGKGSHDDLFRDKTKILTFYKADQGFSLDHPSRIIRLDPSKMSLRVSTALDSSVDALIPIDIDAGTMLLINQSHERIPGLDGLVDTFRNLESGGYVYRLFSLLIENGKLKNCQLSPGGIKAKEDEGVPEWVREGDRVHLLWGRSEVGYLYSFINVKTNTWEPPLRIPDAASVSSMAFCGGSVYCCMNTDLDLHIQVMKIEKGTVNTLDCMEFGALPALVESKDRLVLIWLTDHGIGYKPYERGKWGQLGYIPESIMTKAFSESTTLNLSNLVEFGLYAAPDAKGVIHLLYVKRLPTDDFRVRKTGVFYRTLTPVAQN